MSKPENQVADNVELHLRLFRKTWPERVKLQEIARCLGKLEEQTCLDISFGNPAISHYLRKFGGKWHTVVVDREEADGLAGFVPDNVQILETQELPFKKNTFDIVVVVGVIERMKDELGFVEECHRVLKPDGRLVISVAHVKERSLLNTLRKMLGMTYRNIGLVRSGYTETDLFRVLRDGFNVRDMRSHSRFFVETVDAFVQFLLQRRISRRALETRDLLRFYTMASIMYLLAAQLDMFLFFTRGHYLVASAKRRAWRPRKTPVLIDGRSISEAVLTKPGV